jgi:KDO2-lipid IV(A) lauroyltransferase
LSEPESASPLTHSATWTSHALNTGVVFGATCAGVRRLPRWISYGIGHTGTWLAYHLMRETTTAVIANLRGAFPAMSEAEAGALAIRTYRCYARDVIDFLRSMDRTGPEALALFEDHEEHGALFHSQLAHGRGVILVTGHIGNWEIGSVMLRAQDLPLTIVAMREASEEINRRRNSFRDRIGAETLEVRQSMDTALQLRRRLADNRIVALLMDRHVGRDRVAVKFFGRHAFFLRTPALLAYLTGAPLLPFSIVRLPDGRYRAKPGRPINVSRDLPRDEAVGIAAQAFADDLEARIRETPEYWYQFYRYWESQEAAEGSACRTLSTSPG